MVNDTILHIPYCTGDVHAGEKFRYFAALWNVSPHCTPYLPLPLDFLSCVQNCPTILTCPITNLSLFSCLVAPYSISDYSIAHYGRINVEAGLDFLQQKILPAVFPDGKQPAQV